MYWKKIFSLLLGLALCVGLAGTVPAATITDFVDGNAVYAPDQENVVFVISNRLEFADIDDYTNGGVTSADVVQLLDIPAGMIVNAVGYRVNTAYTLSTCSAYAIDIGDGSDADGWLTTGQFSASASGVSSTYEDGVAGVYQTTDGGKYYSSADTIDMTFPTFTGTWITNDPQSVVTDFVVEVWAEGIMAPTKQNYSNH